MKMPPEKKKKPKQSIKINDTKKSAKVQIDYRASFCSLLFSCRKGANNIIAVKKLLVQFLV